MYVSSGGIVIQLNGEAQERVESSSELSGDSDPVGHVT